MTTTPEISDIAPHVDAAWAGAFVLELRLRGASGTAIGMALAEVESHCLMSGDDAHASFGDATAYAAALEPRDESAWTPGQLGRTVGIIVLLMLGVASALSGVLAAVAGVDARITVGGVVAVGIAVLAVVVVLLTAEPVLRLVLAHPAWSVVAFVAWGVIVGGASALLPTELARIDASATIVLGAACLAAALGIAVVARARGASLDDPIAAPQPRPGPQA